MNVFKRAVIYITRMKARSMILLLYFVVIAYFLLIGLSVHNAARNETKQIKASTPAEISIELQYIDSNEMFDFTNDTNGDRKRILKIPVLTESKLQKIVKLDGISGYFEPSDISAFYTELELQPGFYTNNYKKYDEMDEEQLTLDDREIMKDSQIRMNACGVYPISDGDKHPFFQNKAFQILTGRNIKPKDKNKVVISERLAETNELDCGDSIKLESFDYVNGNLYGTPIRLEIIGIFHMNFDEQIGNMSAENQILSNLMLVDAEHFEQWSITNWDTYYHEEQVVPMEDPVVSSVTIYVDNPENIDPIWQKIENMNDVDWSYYNIGKDSQEYKAIAKPLLSLVASSRLIMMCIVIGAAIILTLLLNLWIRSRKREITILLMIGIRKSNILKQLLLELCLVFVVSFSVAGFMAASTTDAVGDYLIKSATRGNGSQSYETMVNEQQEVTVHKTSTNITNISVTYNSIIIIEVFIEIICIIIFASILGYTRIIKELKV